MKEMKMLKNDYFFIQFFQSDDKSFNTFKSFQSILHSNENEGINPFSQHGEIKKLSESQKKNPIISQNYFPFIALTKLLTCLMSKK